MRFSRQWRLECARRGWRSAPVAASALAIGLVLAACGNVGSGGSSGSGGSNETFNAGATSVVNPSSHKGGTLTFALKNTPDSFDPGNTYYAWVIDMSRLWATPLTTYKSCPGACSNTLVPGIATGLGTSSDNGLTWTYHIKKGLKFSDGEPITAADVKYAVERTYDRSVLPLGPTYFPTLLQDPKYPGPYKDKHGTLSSVTTPNPHEIQFHLAKPFADFNYVVALPQTAPVPPGKDTGANYQKDPVSSGPYEFQSYQLNSKATLVPNPHWTPNEDPQARQLASKVVIELNVNANDVDNRLMAGDVDIDAYGAGVQAAARSRILSSPSLKKYADDGFSNRLWFIYLNTVVKPMNNVHCRRAVEYAASKKDLQTAQGGPIAGGPVASTVLLPNEAGYDKNLDPYQARTDPGGNLAKARQELAACGQPKGFTVGAAYRTDNPEEAAAATALKASLARVGITLDLHGYPTGTYYADFAGVPSYVHSHHLGIDFGGWTPDWPDGYGMLDDILNGNAIASAGNDNVSEVNNPQINSLLQDSASMSATPAQRAADYAKVDQIAMRQAYILPEVYAHELDYRNPATTNVYNSEAYGMYNYAVMGVSNGSGS
ncbi:MAG: ABC transporter substrate-binding protein [Nocardiopsaceae bacterium]|nr:ABC transporter substrate-binding protein [Nocardiopsaceae bacterium]